MSNMNSLSVIDLSFMIASDLQSNLLAGFYPIV